MTQRHLFVGLPSYTGMIWVPTMTGLFFGLWGLQGWRIELCPVLFEADIAITRSRIAMLFLASGATDLLFIDYDVTFNADAVPRLLSHNVDIVGCDYPRRTEPITYSARLKRSGDGTGWITERTAEGLLPIETLPAGLLRISRRAMQRMVEAYPELAFEHPDLPDGRGTALFVNMIPDGRLWGEDNAFCRRWTAIGGQIYVDPEIQVSHWGAKQFAGDYSAWLAKASALPETSD